MKATRGGILILLCFLSSLVKSGNLTLLPDSVKPKDSVTVMAKDSAATEKTDAVTIRTDALTDSATAADTARILAAVDSVNRIPSPPIESKRFIPNPKRALWLALVFPGAGQVYNRKFWKLPIIYGGFLGCTYALMWNQQMYLDYSQAYLDIMDDDPNTNSYMDMLPPRYDITGREEQFKTIFKNKKNYYRRYRDLSAFCFAAVYLLSVIDAYVDAQLSVFDISRDLSMRFEPAVISERGWHRSTSYGIGCSLNF